MKQYSHRVIYVLEYKKKILISNTMKTITNVCLLEAGAESWVITGFKL